MVRLLAKPGSKIAAELTPENLSDHKKVSALIASGTLLLNEWQAEVAFRNRHGVWTPGYAAHAWHMSVGIVGEAGELLDAVKRITIYRKPADRDNLVEEMGDLEFYVTGMEQAMEEVERDNLNGFDGFDAPRTRTRIKEIVHIMDGLYQSFGITREEARATNVVKLMTKRYPNGYSDQAAQERADKAA